MGIQRIHDELSRDTKTHPEMFDVNGNLVPDDIVAFRFDNYDNDDDDEDG